MTEEKKLTARQEAFCQRYAATLNASDAARWAKYSPKTAEAMGHENLQKPELQRRIQQIRAEASKSEEITVARVIEELGKIAFANVGDFVTVDKDGIPFLDLTTVPKEHLAIVSEVSGDRTTTKTAKRTTTKITGAKIKLHDKMKALDLLMKHVADDPDDSAEPVVINFITSEPVGDVNVTRAKG